MDHADGGNASTAAGGEGVDSGPPGSSSTSAGPFQLQIIQVVMNQLFRMEERFATLERKIEAEEQRRSAASSGSAAGPPEAERGRRITESLPFQRNVRPKPEPKMEVTLGQQLDTVAPAMVKARRFAETSTKHYLKSNCDSEAKALLEDYVRGNSASDFYMAFFQRHALVCDIPGPVLSWNCWNTSDCCVNLVREFTAGVRAPCIPAPLDLIPPGLRVPDTPPQAFASPATPFLAPGFCLPAPITPGLPAVPAPITPGLPVVGFPTPSMLGGIPSPSSPKAARLDSGNASTAAGGEGVDSGPPGSSSTSAGPFQLQIIQVVMNQLFRMEERFATLERKIEAEEQRRSAASSGSAAGPPEAERGRRITESLPFQRNVRPKPEPKMEVTLGQQLDTVAPAMVKARRFAETSTKHYLKSNCDSEAKALLEDYVRGNSASDFYMAFFQRHALVCDIPGPVLSWNCWNTSDCCVNLIMELAA